MASRILRPRPGPVRFGSPLNTVLRHGRRTAYQFSGGIAITTTLLPNGIDGETYSGLIEANAPGTFTVFSGDFPSGLTLNADGTITGTPDLGGNFVFVAKVTATDPSLGSFTKTLTIPILVDDTFVPPSIDDLVTWLDDSELSALSDNDPIIQWAESGPRGNDFDRVSPGTEPTYDLAAAAARFNGSTNRLLTAAQGTTNTEYTMAGLFKFNSASGTEGIFRVGDLNGGYGFYKDAGSRAVIHRAVTGCIDSAATTDWEVWSAVRTEGPNLLKFFVNGTLVAVTNNTSNVNTPDGGAMHLGIFATAALLPFAGLIKGLFCYEVPLIDAEREQLENYLIGKIPA